MRVSSRTEMFPSIPPLRVATTKNSREKNGKAQRVCMVRCGHVHAERVEMIQVLASEDSVESKGPPFASVDLAESKRFGSTTLPRAAEATSTPLHNALHYHNLTCTTYELNRRISQ